MYIVDICTIGIFQPYQYFYLHMSFSPSYMYVTSCCPHVCLCCTWLLLYVFTDHSGVGPLCTLQVPRVFCGARSISTRALVEGRIGFEHPSLCTHTVWSWTKNVCRFFPFFFLLKHKNSLFMIWIYNTHLDIYGVAFLDTTHAHALQHLLIFGRLD